MGCPEGCLAVEPVSAALERALRYKRHRYLAPLDPDGFLAWAYASGDEAMHAGGGPLTLDDVYFETGGDLGELRRTYVRIAARVRRNQRLGHDPWEGLR
jgi:hypothetical protein